MERWMVVRPDGTIPGGYRVVQAGLLSEEQAKRWAADYKRPHEAMRTSRLYELRLAAMGSPSCAICREPYDGREHEHEDVPPDDVAAEMAEQGAAEPSSPREGTHERG